MFCGSSTTHEIKQLKKKISRDKYISYSKVKNKIWDEAQVYITRFVSVTIKILIN